MRITLEQTHLVGQKSTVLHHVPVKSEVDTDDLSPKIKKIADIFIARNIKIRSIGLDSDGNLTSLITDYIPNRNIVNALKLDFAKNLDLVAAIVFDGYIKTEHSWIFYEVKET